MKSIFLSGFMGCGKSKVGGILSERLGIPFIDSDAYIVDMVGKSIPDIFEQDGEPAFREFEHTCIKELSQKSNIIIATGGGMMTFGRNWDLVKDCGFVIYINPGFEVCYDRIADSPRPIVRSSTKPLLKDLYTSRHQVYSNHCHTSVNNIHTSSQVSEIILSRIESLV